MRFVLPITWFTTWNILLYGDPKYLLTVTQFQYNNSVTRINTYSMYSILDLIDLTIILFQYNTICNRREGDDCDNCLETGVMGLV